MSFASMDGVSSTPIENSVQFLRLRDKYRSDLFEDSRLNKAAGLAAKQELLLESPAPVTWKEPRLKAVNRELQQWVKKIRQPGGTRGITRDQDVSDEEEENLAVAPFQKLMGHISKISKGIKRNAQQPITPPVQTPVIKQSPSTSKKPKWSFKTGSKAKKWVPKTPKKGTSLSPPSSIFNTADEGATGYDSATGYADSLKSTTGYAHSADDEDESVFGEGETFTAEPEVPLKTPLQQSTDRLKKNLEKKKALSEKIERAKEIAKERAQKRANEAKERTKERAQERALRKLLPAPGWKAFGTPTKRRLGDKDW